MDLNKDDVLRLIEAYHKRTLLWDPKDKWHFNRNKKADAWEEIGKAVGVDVEEAKKKMSSLLGSFRRERAKGKKSVRTGKGANEVYKSEWFAFKSFAFLMDKGNPRASLNSEQINIDIATSPDTETLQEDESHSSSEEHLLETSTTEPIIKLKQEENEEACNFVKPTTQKKRKRALRINRQNGNKCPRTQQAFEFIRRLPEKETATTLYVKYLAEKLEQFDKKTQCILTHKINQLIFEAEMQTIHLSNSPLTNFDNSASYLLFTSPSSSVSSPSPPPSSFHSQLVTPMPIETQERVVSELK